MDSLLPVPTRHACFQLLENLRVYLKNVEMHAKGKLCTCMLMMHDNARVKETSILIRGRPEIGQALDFF